MVAAAAAGAPQTGMSARSIARLATRARLLASSTAGSGRSESRALRLTWAMPKKSGASASQAMIATDPNSSPKSRPTSSSPRVSSTAAYGR